MSYYDPYTHTPMYVPQSVFYLRQDPQNQAMYENLQLQGHPSQLPPNQGYLDGSVSPYEHETLYNQYHTAREQLQLPELYDLDGYLGHFDQDQLHQETHHELGSRGLHSPNSGISHHLYPHLHLPGSVSGPSRYTASIRGPRTGPTAMESQQHFFTVPQPLASQLSISLGQALSQNQVYHAHAYHPQQYDQHPSNGLLQPASPHSRTVYLGNIPADIQPNELLDYVRLGILELVKILPQKNCAFISFVDPQSALLFHLDCMLKRLNIKGNDIKIGWGHNTPILPTVLELIQRDGATRNVYLGNLGNVNGSQRVKISEEELREDLLVYGVIDCIKIIPDKGIAFVHFLLILSAIRCVLSLPQKQKYMDKKCFYGKDRCAFITKTQQHNAAQYLGLAPGMENIVTAADRDFISLALVQQLAAAAQIATQAGGANNLGNRTVYLGNIHQDLTVEEICNVVRGGLLQSVRFLKERHVCFITFVDPIAAAQFFAMCQIHGLTIHNRRIKVGWGKHLGPLFNALSLAVSNGALRNIYVGNIQDFAYYNKDKLREDFLTFGDIEQINYLQTKNCAFVNFLNIANAIKAIDGIKSFPDYKTLKINFGKDRCGNLPRQFLALTENDEERDYTKEQKHHEKDQENQDHGFDEAQAQQKPPQHVRHKDALTHQE